MAFGGESLRRILSLFVHRTQCTHSSNTNLAADSWFEKAKEQQFHTFFIAQIILISHEYRLVHVLQNGVFGTHPSDFIR